MNNNYYAPLLCTEFKMLVQQVLDGEPVSEAFRRRIREHRESCDYCCGFHDSLLGVTALAPEIDPPEEFRNAQSSRLWNRIVTQVGEVNEAPPAMAKSVSMLSEPISCEPPKGNLLNRLDASKIDFDAGNGHIFDLAKFLFDPAELDGFRNLVDMNNHNKRIDRVSMDVHLMLTKLQEIVASEPNVVGTMVLSPDGAVVDSRLGPDATAYTAEEISVWSLAAYHNAQAASEAFGYSGVKQIVSNTESGSVVIANLQGMTLVVLIDGGADGAWAAVERIGSLIK